MKTMVFMHGILGDKRTWQPAFQYLPNHIRGKSYTMKGFGELGQTVPAEQFNTRIHTDELINFCRSLALPKVTIVAWSYSCHIALLAALEAPELFESIHLYDCMVPSYGLEEDASHLKIFSKDLQKMMTPVIQALRTHDAMKIIESFSQACLLPNDSFKQQSEYIKTIKQANSHTVSRLLTQTKPEAITAIALQSLRVPCGVYWGENSRPLFQLASQALLSNLPEHLILQTSGAILTASHLLPENNPAQFIHHILDKESSIFTQKVLQY